MVKLFTSPCPYVPLSKYNWHSVHPYTGAGHCSPLPWNPVVYCVIASCHALTYGLVLELMLQLFFTFRKWTTLYFWVLLACIVGIALLTVSFDLRFFTFHVNNPVVVLTGLGTILMAAGFCLTLYSRLNHITQNKVLLRFVLGTVVFASAVGKIPVVVSESIPTVTGQKAYRKALDVDVLITVEGFFLCGLYIYLFRRKFIQGQNPSRRTRAFFRLLIVAQTVVAIVDVAANVLLFMNYYLPSASTTPLRYAVKVKIEFLILNRLVLFTQQEAAATILPYYVVNNEERGSHRRPSRTKFLHQHPITTDGTGLSRLYESQNSDSILKHSRRPMLRHFVSLPDLSLCKEVDRQMLNSIDDLDKWSTTDRQYLGRFLT